MAPRKSGLSRSKATKYNKRKCTTDHQVQNVESLDGTAECDIPLSKKKGRGPGTMRDATFVIEDRLEIWPVGAHEFACEEDTRQITIAITRLALNYMPTPLRSYHAFDPTTKKNVEKAFLERFRYRYGEDIDHCQTVFDAIAGKSHEPLHVGVTGNTANLQGQGLTTLPQPHKGASGMPNAISQGLGADFIESNERGTFQALLNARLDKRWQRVKPHSTDGSGKKMGTTSPSSVGFCQP